MGFWSSLFGGPAAGVAEAGAEQAAAAAQAAAEEAQRQEQARVAALAAQGLNPDGSPMRPKFESQIDPATGRLKASYIYKPETLDPTSLEGFQAVKKRVMTEGPSAWANLMLEKQRTEEAAQKDMLQRQQAAAQAQARAQLAMRGGMTGGARERLAAGGVQGLMEARQRAAQEGTLARFGVLSEDERQRMALLPQFAEAEAGLARESTGARNRAEQYNIEKALEERRIKEAMEMGKYQEELKKWAAERTAQATEKAAGDSDGTWICTKINQVSPLSYETKNILLPEFKKYVLRNHRGAMRSYLKECGELVERMEEAGVNWTEWVGFEKCVSMLIKNGDFNAAYRMYRNIVLDLIARYWPDCESRNYQAAIDERDNEAVAQPVAAPVDLTEDDRKLLETSFIGG